MTSATVIENGAGAGEDARREEGANITVSKKHIMIGTIAIAITILIAFLLWTLSIMKEANTIPANDTVPTTSAPRGSLAPIAKVPVNQPTTTSPMSDTVTVGGYSEQQLADRGFQLVKGPFTSGTPIGKEGVVYMDMAGNTYERHMLGWRECRVTANGQTVGRYFVGDTSMPHDILATYSECTLIGKRLAAGMRLTTPYEAKVSPLLKK